MKRTVLKFLAAALAVWLAACSGDAVKFNPGTYQGAAPGFGGDITVEVTVSEDRILELSVVSHSETQGIGTPAIEQVPEAIIKGQSLAVDNIAGATYSTKGIIDAATAALVQSGVKIEALQKKRSVPAAPAQKAVSAQTADVVVIGAGGAGLAAAITAQQNGASVIVLEKMSRAGGNTIISGAAYNAADPARQAAVPMNDANRAEIRRLTSMPAHDDFERELQQTVARQFAAHTGSGLFDSPELHMLQTYNGGDYVAKPELVRTFAENALAGLEWQKDNGMGWTGDIFTVLGALWPRSHRPVMPLGQGYIDTDLKYIEAHKDQITVLYDTKATDLIIQDGKVTGVKASGPSADYAITATKGVVIATGGFGANKELRQKYNTQWPNLDNAGTTNHPGATGDGLVLAEKAGASFVGMDWVQLLPMGDPKTGSLSGNIEQGVEDRFFVNKNGDRFVNEGARRDVMTLALFDQTDAFMWVICDKQSYPTPQTKNNFNESIEELIAAGRAFEGNTLEELAGKIGIPAENLVKAAEEFNAGVEAGIDGLGRTLWRIKIDTPPFYAGARIPTVHHTMGGIEINTSTQVLNTAGNVIPGLYAAGEVTGGIHGSNRLGGNALADIHVFGRIAGTSAAAGL
ncbi:MAG: flavocytochrome c [Treponema sp.]|nr:flavocytochrome c [Treponema sp.]